MSDKDSSVNNVNNVNKEDLISTGATTSETSTPAFPKLTLTLTNNVNVNTKFSGIYVVMGVRVPEELRDWINNEAQKAGIDPSELHRRILLAAHESFNIVSKEPEVLEALSKFPRINLVITEVPSETPANSLIHDSTYQDLLAKMNRLRTSLKSYDESDYKNPEKLAYLIKSTQTLKERTKDYLKNSKNVDQAQPILTSCDEILRRFNQL